MKKQNKKTVAVLFGGCSSEYAVSLRSATAVLEHINRDRYDVISIGISREGKWYLYTGSTTAIADDTWLQKKYCKTVVVSPDRQLHGILIFDDGMVDSQSIDIALPILHGKNGEDGTVQGVLELANIPIAGCGTLSSALCMDKDAAHRIVEGSGIAVAPSVVVEKWEVPDLQQIADMGFPLFVKPAKGGSSIGMTCVKTFDELHEAICVAFDEDVKVVIEKAVEGFEVGCGIIGVASLTTGRVDEVELSDVFFDYQEKYSMKSSIIHTPARIDEETEENIRQTAMKIYRSLGCEGFARVDMFFTPRGEVVFNEVNTIPGLTENSRFPAMFAAAGISLKQVLELILETVE